MKKVVRFDKVLALIIAALVVGGALIFTSAAFGLLARGADHITSVAFNHLVMGVGLGLLALLLTTFLDYRIWRQYAPYLYGTTLFLTALVFIPGLGMTLNGATSWLNVFGFSFQPSETLKLGTIVMAAAYFAHLKGKTATITHGLGGFLAILALPTVLLMFQPDFGTLMIIGFAAGAVYFAAGASWRDIGIVGILAGLAVAAVAIALPHAWDRIETFVNPMADQQGQSYQIKQSLIAIGSGGFAGRGFGQGIQKFTYLPEPMGDSIFAVAAEELGFIGASVIVLLFVALALRGFAVAAHAPDMFGALLAVGIAAYLVAEAFINIAAMLGVAPLTGVPLTFISQGGSAMLVSLACAGILLAISRHRVRKSE